jgi:MFS family permease
MILTYLFLRPDPRDVGRQLSPTHLHDATVPARSLLEIFASRQLQLAVAAMVIGQLIMTLIMVITPLHMAHEHHGLDTISSVQLAHTMGMFGLAFVTGWLIDRFGQVSMIVLGGLILAVSSILTPISNSAWVLALALFLLGLGWNFCFTAGSSLMANGVESHERGRAQGFSETLVALASGMGSLGTGPAFAYGGIITVCAIGLVCTLIFLAITFWLTQQSTTPQAVSE